MKSMISALVLASRVTRHYFSSWKGVIVAILTPACMLLILGPSFGSVVHDVTLDGHQIGYMTFFLPGIIALTVFYGSVFTSGNMAVMDRVTGFSDMIKVSPNSSAMIVTGYVLGSAIVGVVQGIIFLVIGLLFSPAFSVSLLSIPAVMFMVAGAAFFGALGFTIGTRVSFDNFSLVFAVLSIPFVYTSTIFVPIEYFPAPAQALILVNPISLLADLGRAALLGLSPWSLLGFDTVAGVLLDGVFCIIFFTLLFIACIHLYPRFSSINHRRVRKKGDEKDSPIDTDVGRAIAREVGVKNLEAWWPLVKEGRIDELMEKFPEETVKRILDLLKQQLNR